ncbi:MAG: DUF169 domain-containing protein [candidate division WOR-3 bacterium]
MLGLKEILSLKGHPVGVKFCRTAEELNRGKIPTEKITFCQMVKISSQGGYFFSCPKEQMGCLTAQFIFGFRAVEEVDIEHHQKQFGINRETAERLIAIKPKLRIGEIKGILVAPLGEFEPELVILILDSAQALPMLEVVAAVTGKDFSFRNGISSALCSYGAVVSYQTQEPNLSIPCFGAKRFGLFQDSELVFTLPWTLVEKILPTLEKWRATNQIHLPIVQAYRSPTNPFGGKEK